MAQIGPKTKSGSFRSKKSTKRTRKSKSEAKKPMMIKTTERSMAIMSDTASRDGIHIEVDKLLSQSNYKLYRQGMNYHVNIEVLNAAGADTTKVYQIYTLPKDHRTIGAIRMARSVYNQAMKDELEIRPEVKSPWTDFKIDLYGPSQEADAEDFFLTGSRAYRAVANADGDVLDSALISDSYQPSEITSNAGNQKRFTLVDDDDTTHWNIFHEYRNFLINRADPDSAAETAAYADASPVLTEMAELADKGDEPPYSWGFIQEALDGTDYNDAALNLQLAGMISLDNNPSQRRSVTVEAPLGLIFVNVSAGTISNTVPELQMTVLKGNYKGVKADMLCRKDKLLGF